MNKKIQKFIDEFIFNKNYYKEDLHNELAEITKEIDDFYLSLENDMSIYKLKLSVNQLVLLVNKKDNFSNKYYNANNKSHITRIIYCIIKNIIMFSMAIATSGLVSIIFFLLGIYILYQNFCNIGDYTKFRYLEDEEVKNTYDILERLQITIENSRKVIFSVLEKSKYKTSPSKINDKLSRDYAIADNLIGYLLQNECEMCKVINNPHISEDVMNIMIKILQNDLNTEEDSLEILIKTAREQIHKVEKETVKELKKENSQ